MIVESLTPRPGIREHNRGVKQTLGRSVGNDAHDPIRTLADCDASRFEDDILTAWYCYQSAKRPFLPELPGQERSPPDVRNFV